MGREFSGSLIGTRRKFAIVAARFNEFITERLLAGARDGLKRRGVAEEDVDLAWVPGAFELPVTALRLARSGRYDAVICLGAILRGETPHFDLVASAAAKGIAQVALDTGVPTIFGVITADTLDQAIERAGTKAGNKGAHAAESAIEMADLFARLDAPGGKGGK
ncbi:MAG: 6,7-dimethyl-8-ribityllumazine synthase [Planctomycetes bacterium]|nr:6,7-dimethyl-8-ribityllumazine synthase [Planctomycetota bacterium]